MAGEKFKVVIKGTGLTVNAGAQPKEGPPHGISQLAAENDASTRNSKAQAMGLKTSYQVVPLDV